MCDCKNGCVPPAPSTGERAPGMARSGSVRPLTISDDVLRRAFENTAALLLANVEVDRD